MSDDVNFEIYGITVPVNVSGYIFVDVIIYGAGVIVRNFEISLPDPQKDDVHILVPVSWNPARGEEVKCVSFYDSKHMVSCTNMIREFFKKNAGFIKILREGINGGF